MEAIKKLRDKNIFNDQSIVESMIQKNWMGSPVIKRGLLRVKKVGDDHCVCECFLCPFFFIIVAASGM